MTVRAGGDGSSSPSTSSLVATAPGPRPIPTATESTENGLVAARRRAQVPRAAVIGAIVVALALAATPAVFADAAGVVPPSSRSEEPDRWPSQVRHEARPADHTDRLDGRAPRAIATTRSEPDAAPTITPQAPRLADRAARGVVLGLLIGLAAAGFSLIHRTTGVANLAHVELVTAGAALAWGLEALIDAPIALVATATVVAGGIGGAAFARVVVTPFQRRGLDAGPLLVVTLAIAVSMRATLRVAMGPSPRSYVAHRTQEPVAVGPIELFPKELWAAGVSAVALTAVVLGIAWVARGGLGARPPERGVRPGRGRIVPPGAAAWIVGSAMAALAGTLVGLIQRIDVQIGDRMAVLVLAAVLLGGLGSVVGAAVGGIAIGAVVEVCEPWAGSGDLIGLAVILGALVVRFPISARWRTRSLGDPGCPR